MYSWKSARWSSSSARMVRIPLAVPGWQGQDLRGGADQGGDEVALTCDLEFLAWHESRDQLGQSGLGFLDRNGMHARAPTLSLGREIPLLLYIRSLSEWVGS